MGELDPIIHQPARLQIMSALCQLTPKERVDFSYLKQKIALTDGNLGAHLATLEAKGYIAVEKTFVGRRPKTFVAPTEAGRAAFAGHVAALESILKTQ
ncbi:MAG TPA: transcriptional regulator [Opitutaceae bacterium]|jgi:DNA-binding MarR family transcriptional regulator